MVVGWKEMQPSPPLARHWALAVARHTYILLLHIHLMAIILGGLSAEMVQGRLRGSIGC